MKYLFILPILFILACKKEIVLPITISVEIKLYDTLNNKGVNGETLNSYKYRYVCDSLVITDNRNTGTALQNNKAFELYSNNVYPFTQYGTEISISLKDSTSLTQ